MRTGIVTEGLLLLLSSLLLPEQDAGLYTGAGMRIPVTGRSRMWLLIDKDGTRD